MTPKLKKIIIIIVIAALVFFVYAIFFKKDPTGETLINTGQGLSAEAQAIGTQISQGLLRLEQIKLDKSIFTNELYLSLVDRSEPIIDEPIGRPNPFAPIGDISALTAVTSATSSKSATTSKTLISTSSSPVNN